MEHNISVNRTTTYNERIDIRGTITGTGRIRYKVLVMGRVCRDWSTYINNPTGTVTIFEPILYTAFDLDINTLQVLYEDENGGSGSWG